MQYAENTALIIYLNKYAVKYYVCVMERNTLGGKRKNAGRKQLPKSEVKQPITIYVKGAIIKQLGGIDKVKIIALNAITRGNE